MQMSRIRLFAVLLLLSVFTLSLAASSYAQSRPQRPDNPKGEGKKNPRPTEEELKKQEEERKLKEEEKNAEVIPGVEKIESNIVNVDAVVYNKKSGQIITGLKKENFAIFEDGVKQDISNFSTPETPITVTLVVEYSKWTEMFGSASGGMSIALATMGQQYLDQANQAGISPEVLHRVAAMVSGGMDTLPHNGAVITLLAVTGLTHRKSYGDIFAMTLIKTTAVFVVIAFYSIFHVY